MSTVSCVEQFGKIVCANCFMAAYQNVGEVVFTDGNAVATRRHVNTECSACGEPIASPWSMAALVEFSHISRRMKYASQV